MKRKFILSLAFQFSFVTVIFPGNPLPVADLILFNGKIITVDRRFTIAEAVAIKKDRILAVGTDREIRKRAGLGTRIIDLQGRTVIPGLIEAHAHPESAALSELDQKIPDLHSIKELLTWIKDQTTQKKEGEWIIHPKLFFTRLKELRQPTLAELDSVSPRHPVFLNGSYGGMINSAALQVSGISADTKDAGILRDSKTGLITGFIRGSVFRLLKLPARRPLSVAEKEQALLNMLMKYNKGGITSVCSGAGDFESYSMYRDLAVRKKLTTRIFQNILVN